VVEVDVGVDGVDLVAVLVDLDWTLVWL